MKLFGTGLLLLTFSVCAVAEQKKLPPPPPPCLDEEAMVEQAKSAVVEVVEAVKKETVQEFQNKYHQKSALNKLTFFLSMVNGAVSCFEKASGDTTLKKDVAAIVRDKHDKYAKLKERLEKDRDALKATENAKLAKGLIEKLDLSLEGARPLDAK